MSWEETTNRITDETVPIGKEPLEYIREALKEIKKGYVETLDRTPTESELFSVVEEGLKEYLMNQDAFEIQDIKISIVGKDID